MRQFSPHRDKERGFALLFVFLLAAVLALGLYKEMPRVAFESQRLREQMLIDRGLQETRGSYRALVRLFNLQPTDYKRFHAFLYQQNCNLPVGPYRTGEAAGKGRRPDSKYLQAS